VGRYNLHKFHIDYDNNMLDAFAETVLIFEREELEEHVCTECTNVDEFQEEDLVDYSTVDNGS